VQADQNAPESVTRDFSAPTTSVRAKSPGKKAVEKIPCEKFHDLATSLRSWRTEPE
jgi:hypothetical protein